MNKKIKNSLSIPILLCIVLVSASLIYYYGNKVDEDEIVVVPKFISHNKDKIVTDKVVADKIVVDNKVFSTTTTNKINTNYAYLFESSYREPNVSNVVGYLGGGAFAFYVPDWIVNKWKIDSVKDDPDNLGVIIHPITPILDKKLSDIVVTIRKSGETFNANTLFENLKKTPIIISEVLLNKHTEGGIKIVTETNTRIYHIQYEDKDKMYDWYFIDGNNNTMSISFSSDKENFYKYSTKIRDFVEGISEVKALQG